jgi:hypothetical protein
MVNATMIEQKTARPPITASAVPMTVMTVIDATPGQNAARA